MHMFGTAFPVQTFVRMFVPNVNLTRSISASFSSYLQPRPSWTLSSSSLLRRTNTRFRLRVRRGRLPRARCAPPFPCASSGDVLRIERTSSHTAISSRIEWREWVTTSPFCVDVYCDMVVRVKVFDVQVLVHVQLPRWRRQGSRTRTRFRFLFRSFLEPFNQGASQVPSYITMAMSEVKRTLKKKRKNRKNKSLGGHYHKVCFDFASIVRCFRIKRSISRLG